MSETKNELALFHFNSKQELLNRVSQSPSVGQGCPNSNRIAAGLRKPYSYPHESTSTALAHHSPPPPRPSPHYAEDHSQQCLRFLASSSGPRLKLRH
ncbi:hypothetical protein Droror1_Dr00010933 [Drosera rotundifolia]